MGVEEYQALFMIWAMHAGIAAVLSAPIVLLGRGRVDWEVWELLILVLPFIVWFMLMFSDLAIGKSLANLGEPFFFALAVPVAALARVAVGSRIDERICAVVLIALMCLVAAGVFFLVPSLPE